MAAEQVAKILDGARPSELPLRQATRFEWSSTSGPRGAGPDDPASLLLRLLRAAGVIQQWDNLTGPETHEGPGSLDPSPSS